MKLSMIVPALLLLAGSSIAPAALADAAEVSATQHGSHAGTRLSVAGEVGRYVVGPLGHVRGFVLKDGTAVMMRDTAGDAMAKDIAVGQSVRVEGFSPTASGGKTILGRAVYGQHGEVVAPKAPGAHGGDPGARQQRHAEQREEIAKLPAISASGTVQTVLEGPRGAPIGVILTDGTSVFLRHSLVRAVATRGIHAGDRIESTGKGSAYALGTSLLAGSLTFADGTHFEARSARSASGPEVTGARSAQP